MIVTQAYRFALDLTPTQERYVLGHAGAARFAYNWGRERVLAVWHQRKAERSYGIPDEQLTPALDWSAYALRKMWNAAKDDVAPWWSEYSKEAYATGLANLAVALKNWNDSRAGKRKGPRMGFPRRKRRHKATPTVRFTTGTIRVEPDRRHVTLPRLGTLGLHESARKLARRLDNGTARILSATVRRESGRWYVSFTCEVTRAVRGPARPQAVIGVDVGVHNLAVLSTGQVIPNPRHYDTAAAKRRRLARAMSRKLGPYDQSTRTRRDPSKRWEKAKRKLGRLEAQVKHLRRDGLHKLTTRLARTYGTVVVEDLNVAGMVRNRRLARAISDAGFGEIRRQLSYKTVWCGGRLVKADRFYPSSKTCSGCGVVKAKLRLAERTYTCTECGLVLDRDLNAARNLAALAATTSAVGVGSQKPDVEPTVRPRSAGQDGDEASTRPRHRAGKAGTADPQGLAA